MKRITIVNVGSESNKGTAAITIGLIRLLIRLFPHIKLRLISLYHNLEKPMAYKLTLRTFPDIDIEIVDHPRPLYGSPYMKALECMLIWTFRERLCFNHPVFDVIKDSDLVIARSSPIFAGRSRFLNYSAARASLPLYVAKKIGIPYGFAPQTFWPIKGLQIRNIIKTLCKSASFVCVRDVYSFGELCRLGVDPVLCLDSGFWIEPKYDKWLDISSHLDLQKRKFIVIVPRSTGDFKADEAVFHKIAETLKKLLPTNTLQIILVQHNFVEDSDAIKLLASQLKQQGLSSTCLQCEEWSPEELAGLYQHAAFVMGMRVHSIIMALVAGTPVIGINIDGRMQAILKSIKMDSFVIDVKTFEHEVLAEIVQRALSLDYSRLSEYISLKKRFDEMIFRNIIAKALQR